MMKDSEYIERMGALTVRGVSEGRWIRIRRMPDGHFAVDVKEREFAHADECELTREVLSALEALQRDYRRQVLEVREERFGSDLGIVG